MGVKVVGQRGFVHGEVLLRHSRQGQQEVRRRSGRGRGWGTQERRRALQTSTDGGSRAVLSKGRVHVTAADAESVDADIDRLASGVGEGLAVHGRHDVVGL
jgi:hypothetical protein